MSRHPDDWTECAYCGRYLEWQAGSYRWESCDCPAVTLLAECSSKHSPAENAELCAELLAELYASHLHKHPVPELARGLKAELADVHVNLRHDEHETLRAALTLLSVGLSTG